MRGTVPHYGYENNIMGSSTHTNLNTQQYRSWLQYAISRSKANKNTNRIKGFLQVDRNVKTGEK